MLRPEKMVPQQPELATSIWADIYAAAETADEQIDRSTHNLNIGACGNTVTFSFCLD